MSREEFDEVFVRKHCKFRNEFGSLAIHSSKTAIGVWLARDGEQDTPVGMCFDTRSGHGNPYLFVYPDRKHSKLPFAISKVGVQIPGKDGKVVIVSFEKLAEAAESLLSA